MKISTCVASKRVIYKYELGHTACIVTNYFLTYLHILIQRLRKRAPLLPPLRTHCKRVAIYPTTGWPILASRKKKFISLYRDAASYTERSRPQEDKTANCLSNLNWFGFCDCLKIAFLVTTASLLFHLPLLPSLSSPP